MWWHFLRKLICTFILTSVLLSLALWVFFLPVSVNGRRLSNMHKWAALKSLGACYSLGPRSSPTKACLAQLLCLQTSESSVAHRSTVRFPPHIRGLTDRESLKFLSWATNARTEHCCPWCWKQCHEGLKAQRCLLLTWSFLHTCGNYLYIFCFLIVIKYRLGYMSKIFVLGYLMRKKRAVCGSHCFDIRFSAVSLTLLLIDGSFQCLNKLGLAADELKWKAERCLFLSPLAIRNCKAKQKNCAPLTWLPIKWLSPIVFLYPM